MFKRIYEVGVLILLSGISATQAEDAEFAVVQDEAGRPVAVELRSFNGPNLEKLLKDGHRPAVFEVRVEDAAASSPAMAGKFAIERDSVRFTPRFRFRSGLKYRATCPVLADSGLRVSALTFEIPMDVELPAAEVAAIYPSTDGLPENQLKFYLHFSAPMSRGEAYNNVRLVRDDGTEVDLPFLEIGEELWDRTGTRLTLLIDPGRIKQGVKPREDVGPVFEVGRRYTLHVRRGWKDASGRPLLADFEKQFHIAAPVSAALDTKAWRFELPAANTRQPLKVRFPAPLDHALLQRTLWVEDRSGNLEGTMEVAAHELGWQFTPKDPWTSEDYCLVVDAVLEDLGGNRIGSAFEVDALNPLQKRIEVETIRLPLHFVP
jgi:hypothetical protein